MKPGKKLLTTTRKKERFIYTGKEEKQKTDNLEGKEQGTRVFKLHKDEKEQQSQQYVQGLEELREENRKKIVEDKAIEAMNTKTAFIRERRLKK